MFFFGNPFFLHVNISFPGSWAKQHEKKSLWEILFSSVFLLCICIVFGFILYSASDVHAKEGLNPPTENALRYPLVTKSLLLDIKRFSPDAIICVGQRGHVIISRNNGKTWHQAEIPTRTMLNAVFFYDQNHGWAAGHNAEILATRDGGKTWIHQFYAPEKDQPILDIYFVSPKLGYAIGAYGLFLLTRDGGITWEEKYYPSLDDPEFGLPHFYAILLSKDGNTLFMAGEAGLLARSNDFGGTWLKLAKPYEGSYFGLLITRQNTLLAFGLRGNVYRSDNLGVDWEHIPTPTKDSINSGVCLGNGKIILTAMNGVLLHSTDDGKHFEITKRTDRMAISDLLPVEKNRMIMIGENGLHWVDGKGVEISASPF